MSYSDISPFLWAADLGLAVVAIGFALARRRGFASTLTWIFAIIGIPILGSLAYLLLANPIIRRTRLRRHRTAQHVRGVLGACGPSDVDAAPGLTPAFRSVFQLAERLTGMPPSLGNSVELLTDNVGAFARIQEAIRAARLSIWAEYYIINNDETGNRFLDLLVARARDGIDVRLLYDAVGSSKIDAARVEALRAAGGHVEEFLPVNPLRRRWAVHLRNHRKILVVDGEIGFTGGMNVGDEYSGSSRIRHVKAWRDAHMALRGPAVRDLAEIFTEDWCFTSDECPVPPDEPPCETPASLVAALPSGPDQSFNANGLVYFAGINCAVSRCWITSPYFIPDEATLRAMTCAALRGVDMRVLVPRLNDLPLMAPAIRSFYPALVEAGVRVYEYVPTMLHAKTMVVDGALCLVGSANLDMRSFRLNFEASLLVHDPVFAQSLENQFESDLSRSEEVTADILERRTPIAVMLEGAAQLLSPLL